MLSRAWALLKTPAERKEERMPTPLTVLIASYLEPALVEQIRACDPRINVIYEPDLLGAPRYISDHTAPPQRTPAQEAHWRELLAQADVLFDFDWGNLESLPDLAPRLRWIQATSAGIGQLVRRQGYAQRTNWIFTTASGVHIGPLAEFVMLALLMFSKDLFGMQRAQAAGRWERTCSSELTGQTLAIVGLGRIGREVATRAKCFGMRVIASKRHVGDASPTELGVDAIYSPDGLAAMLSQANYLVLVAPHTDETEHLIGPTQFAALPPGAVLINIGRGALVDEAALIESLRSGHLAGAALDVFATEPLPPDSPLWAMPNVLVSPHSASTSAHENRRIADLFCQNLRRFLDDAPLQNVLDTQLLY
jgi:glyoxylate/hydroxypyruvate reductase A